MEKKENENEKKVRSLTPQRNPKMAEKKTPWQKRKVFFGKNMFRTGVTVYSKSNYRKLIRRIKFI